MRHLLFAPLQDSYPVAVLVKSFSFNEKAIRANYVEPLVNLDVGIQEQIAFTLEYDDKGKASATFIKEYLAKLLPELQMLGVTHLYVTDAAYFKVLAKVPKAEPHIGYVLPCKVAGFEHMNVVLGLNFQQLIYDPKLQTKLDRSLQALASHLQGRYEPPGCDIIHSGLYPVLPHEIRQALAALQHHPSLTCDIEGFSLHFWEAGIGTISFAWDEHNGVAFPCDYYPYEQQDPITKAWGCFHKNPTVRGMLRHFFETYQGELTFHNAPYDAKAIIFALWMDDVLGDTKGLLTGLDVLTRAMHDTKVITYLAVNSTAGNTLGLKTQAHEFAGNWAQEEISDITMIPLPQLLQYNLVDGLATWFVRKKHYPTMVADQQEKLYKELMLPSLKLIIQMEMTGLPINAARLQEVKAEVVQLREKHLAEIHGNPRIAEMDLHVQTKAMDAANAKLKTKQHPLEKFKELKFNPGSPQQLQVLLYQHMGLPVIDLTDTKQPATGGETLEKLIHHTTNPNDKALLQALIDWGTVDTVMTTFIPAFERAVAKAPDGFVWLFGNFNLNGTVSGRLSSSGPNLQNLPAGNTGSLLKQLLGKLIKSMFQGPPGWLFCGADFNSLEDYVSALTTKDPNKLNVYIRGFDGHCLRAAYYYRDQLADIDLEDPKSVNSIKKLHPELRQESKTPTFALTYQGTYHTLMANLGWSKEKAQQIEASYHELYKVSDQYVADRLKQASKEGFVEVAFGLRVRTPLIKQVVWGSKHMPYEAAAEGRTAGNALGQSYGLLNNRAAVDFWKKVWASKHRYEILPCALIHDAIYPLVRDTVDAVDFANRELIKSMRWQELPELQHDTVKLGAALDIFWPDWAHPITLPNDCDQATLISVCRKAREDYDLRKEATA